MLVPIILLPPTHTPSAGTVTVNCAAGTPFTLTSGPEAEEPEFTLSCTSRGGPVRGFNWASGGGGNIAGVASLKAPVNHDVRDQGLYDHSVTVTGNYPGDYTCQVTVYRYDGTAPEPEILVYPSTPGAAQTITVPGELVNIILAIYNTSFILTLILLCLSC